MGRGRAIVPFRDGVLRAPVTILNVYTGCELGREKGPSIVCLCVGGEMGGEGGAMYMRLKFTSLAMTWLATGLSAGGTRS